VDDHRASCLGAGLHIRRGASDDAGHGDAAEDRARDVA
jgi:hypothetical protein